MRLTTGTNGLPLIIEGSTNELDGDASQPAGRVAVLCAHQETMRRFLEAQQIVIQRFLSQQQPVVEEPCGEIVEPTPHPPAEAPPVGRYVMQGRSRPLPSPPVDARLDGLYLVTGNTAPASDSVVETLRQFGAHAEFLPASVLKESAALNTALTALREVYGPVRGVVHLAGLGALSMPDSIAGWQIIIESEVKNFFRLLQGCADDLRKSGKCLAVSGLDGSFGRDGTAWRGLPIGGACAGMLKTAALEWPDLTAKAIDLETLVPETVSSIVLAELLSPDIAQEIGYRAGNRIVFEAALEPLAPPSSETIDAGFPASDWVVLATGGARGITAEAVAELVVPGMTLVLVGRAPEPGEETASTQGVEGVPELRKIFLGRAKEQGLPPSPVQIEKEISSLLRDRAIHKNLDEFRERGVRVEYHSVDVRDPDQFGAVIEAIYQRHGRIDAVIHGAGVIEDKLLVDKSIESFDRVFDTKADSTFVLAQRLRPETLKWLIFFTSVAGRTGNRGQCDYAAANELVNRCAWWLHSCWPQVKIKAFNWGPWESGMASDEVNRQFRERGVIPIPPQAGREFLLREMRFGAGDEVELVAGTFEEQQAPPTPSRSFPLLRSQLRQATDGSVEYEHVFSIEHEPFLLDHRIDEVPVVPVVGAMELMAEVVQAAWPELHVAEVLKHRLLRGIVLKDSADKTVLVRARATGANESGDMQVSAEIADTDRSGALFYKADFLLRKQLPHPPLAPESAPIPPVAFTAAEAYHDHLFHGPKFQLLGRIDGLNHERIDATAPDARLSGWLKRDAASRDWLFNPGLMDAALQAELIWCRLYLGTFALPNAFGRVIRYGALPADIGLLKVSMTITGFDATTIHSEFYWTDEQDRVWLKGEKFESTTSKALNRLAKSPPPIPIFS